MKSRGRVAWSLLHGERSIMTLKGALTAGVTLAWLAIAGGADAGGFIPNQGRISAPRAASEICTTYSWACAASTRATVPALDEIQAVSRRINRSTRPIADKTQYRKADVWTLPTSRGGDCEDFALLKKRELIARGHDPSRLLLTTVLDESGQSHAVLVVRTESGDYVADNLRDSIRPWNRTGYTFLRMQDPDAPHRWLRLNVRG